MKFEVGQYVWCQIEEGREWHHGIVKIATTQPKFNGLNYFIEWYWLFREEVEERQKLEIKDPVCGCMWTSEENIRTEAEHALVTMAT